MRISPRFFAGRNVAAQEAGFTLLELILGMAIVAVFATFSFRFVAGSMAAYADAEQRFSLIEKIDPALSRMTAELSQALPFSVRITPNGQAMEFALVVDGGYYRTQEPIPQPAPPAPPLIPLEFNTTMAGGAGNEFSLMGGLKTIDSVRVSDPNGDFYDLLGPDYAVSVGHYGEIGADGNPLPGFNVYAGPTATLVAGVPVTTHVVSPPGATLSTDNRNTFVRLPADHVFPIQSPARRLNVINGFISYICANGRLYRRQRTLAQRSIVQDANIGGAVILASGISNCRFSQDSGSFNAGPMAAVTLRLNHPNDNGALVVLRQVRIKAAP